MAEDAAALDELADYAAGQRTTGLLVVQAGRTLIERNFAPPAMGSETFMATLARGRTADGALREDVASQQKSLIALLAGQAADRRLLDVERPVSDFIGAGWTKAEPAAERRITVRSLMQMSCGLTDQLTVEAPVGTKFFYNTPAYARLQRVLEQVGGQPLDALTREWLTGPLGMAETAWQPRPAALAASSGNAWGLVTAPRDLARLGRLVLDGGAAPDGARLISTEALRRIFTAAPTNPAYGRLWWLNNGAWSQNAQGERREGRLVPPAPPDLVLALGAQGRVLGVAPSRSLIVVRLGQQPIDADFAAQFWRRAMAAVG